MAAHTSVAIAPVRNNEKDKFRNLPLAASQDFERGAIIVPTGSGGTYEEAAADPQTIVGVALAAYSDYEWMDDTFGFVNPVVPIALADQEFRGTLDGAAVADISAIIGNEYGLIDNSGNWEIDQSETTTTSVRITGVDDVAEDGDSNIPVTFVFIRSVREEVA